MVVKEKETLMIGLGQEDALDVLIKPILKSSDPLRNDDLNIFYKMYNITKEKDLVHLQKPKSVVQAGFTKEQSKAGEVKPYGEVSHSKTKVKPVLFDIWTEHYPEDIREAIDNIRAGKGNMYHSIDGTKEEQELLSAFIYLIQETAGNDIYRAVFFGDTDFEMPTGDDVELDATQVKMLKQINGIWKDIYEKVGSSDKIKKITRIDLTKDVNGDAPVAAVAEVLDANGDVVTPAVEGTKPVKGNDLPVGYVMNTLLPSLYSKSNIKLRQLKKTAANVHDKPVYLVSEAIYEAYKRDLKKEYKTTWMSFELHYKGEGFDTEIPIGLKFDNYAVIPVYEWDLFDSECGKSNQHKAMFIARKNLTIATDVNVLPGGFGAGQSSLTAVESPLVADLGKVDVRATMKIDAAVAESHFITVAY